MKVTFPVLVQTVIAASILTLFSHGAMARDNQPTINGCLSEGDGSACYNCLSRQCKGDTSNDMGDPSYAACINKGMNSCDGKFPKFIRVNPLHSIL